MEIKKEDQFNQEIDSYKLLSTASGVGALLATRVGTFLMPIGIKEWGFIHRANRKVDDCIKSGKTKFTIDDAAVDVVHDERFVNYLKTHYALSSLEFLIRIPQLQLDNYNYPDVYNSPLFKKYFATSPTEQENKNKAKAMYSDFTVPAIVFPRWLYSANKKSNKLLPMSAWKAKWHDRERAGQTEYKGFAPPRDAESQETYKDPNGKTCYKYGLLKQMPLVLICEKGHISDIPWDKYFDARRELGDNVLFKEKFDLFGYTSNCSCKHELTYTESINKSSGFGVLKCKKCGEVVSLDGIMNLKPACPGERPWLGVGDTHPNNEKCDKAMRVSLLTSSGVYFADNVSSLYVTPSTGGTVLTDRQNEILTYIQGVYNRMNNSTPMSIQDFWKDNGAGVTFSMPYQIGPVATSDVDAAVSVFLAEPKASAFDDYKTEYRFEEYEVFSNNTDMNIPRLRFHDIVMPASLVDAEGVPYFKKICQVDTLCITRTQMNFFRCQYPTVTRDVNTGKINPPEGGMSLYGDNPTNVYVYPALQDMGEGLFFEFNEEAIQKFMARKAEKEPGRYSSRDYKMCSELSTKLDLYNQPEKFYLLHTFAHILIKELEFSCGYPSASLSERIYFSDKMQGVLIYTTGSSEGSMGGLVWQGQSARIEKILQRALDRACQCSSDPLCWMHAPETMNYASCFSCTMISENSCEYRNYGLDRRALVDDEFGYFKDLL